MLTGLLELDGVAMAGRRVLLISGDMTRLIASTTTDDGGVFSFALPDLSGSTVVVLAKIQGPVLSIAYRIIELPKHGLGPHRISIDSTSEAFHSIRGQMHFVEGRPPYLLLHVDPLHLTGIPAPLERFFRTVDEHVIDSWFYQARLDDDSFELRVQNGIYRVDGQYFNKWDAQPGASQSHSLRQAMRDGEETLNFESPFESFTLNVDRDRHVEMTIGPIADDV